MAGGVLKIYNPLTGERVEIGGATGSDSDAIHDNVSGEIAAITEKASPVAADLIVIEDSEASNVKKRATLVSILGALSLTNARKRTKIFYIENPTDSDDFPVMSEQQDITLDKIRSYTDVGTVTLNIEERITPAGSGVITLTSSLVADVGGEASSTFSNDEVDAEDWLAIVTSAVASSPTKLWVAIDYTIDA